MCDKIAFRSKGEADKSKKTIHKHNGSRKMRSYLCPECHYWHLTTTHGGKKFHDEMR